MSARHKRRTDRDAYLQRVYARGEVPNPDAMGPEEFGAFAAYVRATIPEMAAWSDARIKEDLKDATEWLAPNSDVASTLVGFMAQQAMAGDAVSRKHFQRVTVTDDDIARETLPDARDCLIAIAGAQRMMAGEEPCPS